MPLCVTCTTAAPYLYTVYKTKSNIRLAVCVSAPSQCEGQDKRHPEDDLSRLLTRPIT